MKKIADQEPFFRDQCCTYFIVQWAAEKLSGKAGLPKNKPIASKCIMKTSDFKCGAKTEFAFPGLGSLQRLWILTLLLFLGFGSAEVQAATGKAYVTDGDSIRISGEEIRLEGIDAPEKRQRCRNADGKTYSCGFVATSALKNKIGSSPVTCRGNKRDRYGRLLGICYLGELDLNGWMVRNGYAIAYARYSQRYVVAEREARKDSKGLWAGEFVPPWRWRRGERLASE